MNSNSINNGNPSLYQRFSLGMEDYNKNNRRQNDNRANSRVPNSLPSLTEFHPPSPLSPIHLYFHSFFLHTTCAHPTPPLPGRQIS